MIQKAESGGRKVGNSDIKIFLQSEGLLTVIKLTVISLFYLHHVWTPLPVQNMGIQKRTRKFAQGKRAISLRDSRLFVVPYVPLPVSMANMGSKQPAK